MDKLWAKTVNYLNDKFIFVWIKGSLFDEGQIFLVKFRIKVVVEVVENNQRPYVVDEDEGDEYHTKDEEDPQCPKR